MISSADRCRNCGLLHKTQTCPSYGPMFPAPGKTKDYYNAEYERIQNLLAADILAEHYGHDEDDSVYHRVGHGHGHGPVKEAEMAARDVTCPICHEGPGEVCRTSKGERAGRSHAQRLREVGSRRGAP